MNDDNLNNSNNLKPVRCGCGGEALIRVLDSETPNKRYYVICKKCGISTWLYLMIPDAIEAWNRAMGERTAKPEWWDGYSEKGWYKCACEKGVYQGQNYCSGCCARLEWE